MQLCYSPLACSLAARIVCVEGGLEPTFRRADLATKRIEGEADGALLALNPLGKVPTLVLEDGSVLTENVAVLLYLGERAGLAPREGRARFETLEWLSFVATEVHKRVLSIAFSLDRPAEPVKQNARDAAARPLATLDRRLRDRDFLVGESFGVADAYLVWALVLLPRRPCCVSLDPYPALAAYVARHLARESVKSALVIESREYAAPGWWTAKQLD